MLIVKAVGINAPPILIVLLSTQVSCPVVKFPVTVNIPAPVKVISLRLAVIPIVISPLTVRIPPVEIATLQSLRGLPEFVLVNEVHVTNPELTYIPLLLPLDVGGLIVIAPVTLRLFDPENCTLFEALFPAKFKAPILFAISAVTETVLPPVI
ncbi:hypothetical protein ES705_34939 [subsurface metagenome]